MTQIYSWGFFLARLCLRETITASKHEIIKPIPAKRHINLTKKSPGYSRPVKPNNAVIMVTIKNWKV